MSRIILYRFVSQKYWINNYLKTLFVTIVHNRLEILAEEEYLRIANEISNYDLVQSLVFIKNFIQQRRKIDHIFININGKVTGYHIFPFIIDLVLRHSTLLPGRNTFDLYVLEWLVEKHLNYPEMVHLIKNREDINKYVPETLIRYAFEQIPYQETNTSLIPRSYLIFKQIPEANSGKHKNFLNARDLVLNRLFRVDLDDIFYCSFTLAAIAEKSDFLGAGLTTEIDRFKKYVETDAIKIIRGLLTINKDEYISQGNSKNSYIYKKYEYFQILKTPIVKINNCDIVPNVFIIPDRVTKLLNEYFIQYFYDNQRISDYTNHYGDVFKEYVGYLLDNCFINCLHIDLDAVDWMTGKKADYLMLNGDKATIFECKALKYPAELKRTGSLEILESFLVEKIAYAVDQCTETEKQIYANRNIIPEVSQIKYIYKYVVIEDSFEYINDIIDFIPDSGIAQRIMATNTQIMSILELETLVASNFASKYEVLSEKSNAACRHLSFDKYLKGKKGFEYTRRSVLDELLKRFTII